MEVYQGLDRYLNCRGLGACGTCRLLVKNGKENLSPKGIVERVSLALHWISSTGFEDEIRLSCQCTVVGDISVEVRPEANLCGENFWQKPYPNK